MKTFLKLWDVFCYYYEHPNGIFYVVPCALILVVLMEFNII